MCIKWKSLLYLGLLLLGVFCLPSIGRTMILDYTIPRYNANLADPDSNGIYELVCDPDTSLANDLHYINIYRDPFSGGGFNLFRQKDVSGRGGETDTLNVPDDGSYYITAEDLIGNESCASDVVNGPLVTGVMTEEFLEHSPMIVKRQWFDVQGRLLNDGPIAGGVYFRKYTFEDGSYISKKKVIIK